MRGCLSILAFPLAFIALFGGGLALALSDDDPPTDDPRAAECPLLPEPC
jgi:hypothetical protein